LLGASRLITNRPEFTRHIQQVRNSRIQSISLRRSVGWRPVSERSIYIEVAGIAACTYWDPWM
jgi:hypothetical protein